MFYIRDVLNPNVLRAALLARESGVVFDLTVVIAGATSVMQLRGRTLFPGREEELKTLGQFPALNESEVRFYPEGIDPLSKKWVETMIILDTERCTGSVTYRV
jgi:hypothetical protein